MSWEILKQLEERIAAVLARAEQLRQANQELTQRLAEEQHRLEEATAQLKQFEQQNHQQENERVEIRTRIEKLLEQFNGLDLA